MDFIIEDEQFQPVTIERDIVPAGMHEMTIRHAEEGPNEYKVTDVNPDGMCLKLRLATSSGNYKFVFDDIPKHLGWRAKQLADAIGLAAAGGKISLDPGSLVGCTVTVEISHYTAKSGKVSAVVKRYVQATPKSSPKPKASSRTAPPKEVAASDVPF